MPDQPDCEDDDEDEDDEMNMDGDMFNEPMVSVAVSSCYFM